jgi:hypothetical protein
MPDHKWPVMPEQVMANAEKAQKKLVLTPSIAGGKNVPVAIVSF